MRLKHHIVPLLQNQLDQKTHQNGLGEQGNQERPISTEDAWLNDVGPKTPPVAPLVNYEDISTVLLPSTVTPSGPALVIEGDMQSPGPAIQADHSNIEVSDNDPLEALLADEHVMEVMALGPRQVYARRGDTVQKVCDTFDDQQHLLRVIQGRLTQAGLPLLPLVDGYLPDGSLLSVTLPPYAVHGPTILIKKRHLCRLTLEELVRRETLSRAMADFLGACVEARLNIIVCGARRSGKTTLLQALCTEIASYERIVTIEEMAELRLSQPQAVALVANTAAVQGNRRVTVRDLLMHGLHMWPERMIVGECRGDELGTLLQAMDAGQKGIMTTLYAPHLRDGVARLDALRPVASAHALDLVVQSERMRDGSYRVTNIAEVQGVSERGIKILSIFYYRCDGQDGAKGVFQPSGMRPRSLLAFNASHVHVPRQMFVPERQGH